LRCEKLCQGATARDLEFRQLVSRYQTLWQDLQRDQTAAGTFDPEIEQLGWMIEELRVSLFAQQLGTSLSVSPKRLDRQIAKFESNPR
jgi:ATP-dependent helicase HrpA